MQLAEAPARLLKEPLLVEDVSGTGCFTLLGQLPSTKEVSRHFFFAVLVGFEDWSGLITDVLVPVTELAESDSALLLRVSPAKALLTDKPVVASLLNVIALALDDLVLDEDLVLAICELLLATGRK